MLIQKQTLINAMYDQRKRRLWRQKRLFKRFIVIKLFGRLKSAINFQIMFHFVKKIFDYENFCTMEQAHVLTLC